MREDSGLVTEVFLLKGHFNGCNIMNLLIPQKIIHTPGINNFTRCDSQLSEEVWHMHHASASVQKPHKDFLPKVKVGKDHFEDMRAG